MITFSVLIACALHSANCHGEARFTRFEAESRAMCEQNIRLILDLTGMDSVDFTVICAERIAA